MVWPSSIRPWSPGIHAGSGRVSRISSRPWAMEAGSIQWIFGAAENSFEYPPPLLMNYKHVMFFDQKKHWEHNYEKIWKDLLNNLLKLLKLFLVAPSPMESNGQILTTNNLRIPNLVEDGHFPLPWHSNKRMKKEETKEGKGKGWKGPKGALMRPFLKRPLPFVHLVHVPFQVLKPSFLLQYVSGPNLRCPHPAQVCQSVSRAVEYAVG